MKVIDICDDYGSKNCLKGYYDLKNVTDYFIISTELSLGIGDIKNNHIDFLRKLYNDSLFENDSLKILDNVNTDTIFRIWSSKKDNDSYLLLLYVCYLLKDKNVNIHVVYSTDYNENALSISSIESKEIEEVLKYEKVLSFDEINNYAKKWCELVEVNSDLRIIENEEIINKNYSDYDDIILMYLSEENECSIAQLIAKLVIGHVINDVGDIVYLYLINRLIDMEKIKVVKKESNLYQSIIESNDYEFLSNDCKIKWLENYKLLDTDIYTQVSAYVFNDNDEMLIVKNEKEDTWTIPGGHPEIGESKEETLKREMMEEACCTLKDINYLGAVHVIEKDKSYYQLRYTAHVDKLEPFKQEMEISERKFVKIQDLKKYIKWADGLTFKKQLLSAINLWKDE